MRSIIPDQPSATPDLPASGRRESRDPSGGRLARLAELDPEQPRLALAFLSGFRPRVFDAILDAVEPPATQDDTTDQEPFCARCGAPVGIFLAHGPDYRHYRGAITATSKPKPYKADHAPVIAWRPAA
jgi:ribosomal protein S27AE